jgi:PAS domain S-box-containing protein
VTDDTAAPSPDPDRWSADSLRDAVLLRSLDAIIVTDAEYVVRVWNPAAETIYGVPAAIALGRPIRDSLETFTLAGDPLDPATASDELRSTGVFRQRVIHRPRIGELAGRDVVVDSVVTLISDGDGRPAGALGINRDVGATAALESEMAALGSIGGAAGQARTKAEVAAAALEILCRATGADAGLVTSMDSTYEATAQIGVSPGTIEVILSFGQLGGPLARALEAPDAYVSADVATAPLREDVRSAVLADGIGHLIVVGLRLAGRLTGILALGWRQRAPHEPSRAVMHQAAALVASSLENARLIDAVERGLAEERLLTRRMRALVELTRLPETTARGEFDTTRLLTEVRTLVGARAALYAQVDGDRLRLAGADDPSWEAARPFVDRPLHHFPAIAELQAGATALLFPAGGPLTSAEGAAAVAGQGFLTLAVFAVRDGESIVGVVFVGFDQPIDEVEIDERTLEAIGRVLDISFANRRLREVVSASERRYRDLFEHSPEALLVETRDLAIVDANPAAVRLYGEGLIGRHVTDLVEGEPMQVDIAGDRQAVLGGTGIGRRLDGTTFPEEVELRAIDIGGEPHTLAIVRDLTERTRLQSELVQAQKMEAIGHLVAGVAHELNNPLAAIVTFSQLIRSDPDLPADLRTQADLLVQEANRTRVIVQNLLDFARQRPPERVRTELRPLIDSVLGLQSYVLQKGRLTIDVDVPGDLPAILVDRAQLQQVLINLTFNSAQAIHETARPGTIRISASRIDRDGDELVRIAVADDGPGVAAEVADRLFMPFVTTKAPGDGTGLGLSVSFGIIAGHGGSLRHEPNEAGGATFVIELPVGAGERAPIVATARRPEPRPGAVEALAPPEPPTARVARAGRPLRILVLDDEPAIRDMLGRVLTRYGYEPILASTGAAALDVVRRDPPAGILCDHRMAGMSGTEFHAAVSEIAPDLGRHFAFMSGDVLNPELRAFAQARGVHLLAKPFDLSTVDAMIATLLAEPALPAEPAGSG